MAKPVPVQYVGPFGEVYLPILGAVVKHGETVQVAADLAGTAPGPWRPATPEDSIDWPRRTTDDGTTETHDPGTGLLAQADNWLPVTGEKG